MEMQVMVPLPLTRETLTAYLARKRQTAYEEVVDDVRQTCDHGEDSEHQTDPSTLLLDLDDCQACDDSPGLNYDVSETNTYARIALELGLTLPGLVTPDPPEDDALD